MADEKKDILCPYCGSSLDNLELFEELRVMDGNKFMLFGLCCGVCRKVLNIGLGPVAEPKGMIVEPKGLVQ